MKQSNQFLKNIYLKSLFPNMIVLLGDTMHVLVASILIGQRMGDCGIAAVNQSLAVYLLLYAIGSLFAVGASAKSSYALGQKDIAKAKRYFSIGIECAFVIGFVVCMVGFFCTPLLAEVFGSDMSKGLLKTYMGITFLGGIFKILMYIPYHYLPLEGNINQSVLAMTLMTTINVILNYVFLFQTDWGIAGAGWASVISTAVACILSFQFLNNKSTVFQFQMVKPTMEELKDIVYNGSSVFANYLFSALRIVVLNMIMNLAGGSSAVTIFAITNHLNECAGCIQNGIPQTGESLMRICKEERDNRALESLLKLQIKTGLILSAITALVMSLFSNKIGFLFGSSLHVQMAVICWAVSLVVGTFNNVMINYYYAIRQVRIANLIMLLRHLLITAGVAWFMKDMGDELWLFYPIAEMLTLMIWIICGEIYAKWDKKKNLLLMEDNKVSIDLVVGCDRKQICEVNAYANDFCEEIGLDMEQTMMLSLAIEELLMLIAKKSLHNEGIMELRILQIEHGALLRIRAEGEPFNPLDEIEETMDFMGLLMMKSMAVRTEYQSTLGLNTLIVEV